MYQKDKYSEFQPDLSLGSMNAFLQSGCSAPENFESCIALANVQNILSEMYKDNLVFYQKKIEFQTTYYLPIPKDLVLGKNKHTQVSVSGGISYHIIMLLIISYYLGRYLLAYTTNYNYSLTGIALQVTTAIK